MKVRSKIPMILRANERFSTKIADALLGQETKDGWTVVMVTIISPQHIDIFVEKEVDPALGLQDTTGLSIQKE